ncbi:TetR/AcrR family transcriptional regulator [Kibdelosporangium persicum]|nr:TetR/AcrR family transcriptional regulator [Kibdelosporangium persicum]
MPPDPSLPNRRDARRNRDLFIEHAKATFAEHGVDASLERIAREAGLAIGTLYRHFPTRVDLLLAVFEPKLRDFLATAEAALKMADPWEGFLVFLEALCGAQAYDRGFNDFIARRFPRDERTEVMHDRVCQLARSILSRAQAAGVVRPDIAEADLIALLWANSRIAEATRQVAPGVWRRHMHLVIDGFRAGDRHELPEPSLSPEQLYRVMARLGE